MPRAHPQAVSAEKRNGSREIRRQKNKVERRAVRIFADSPLSNKIITAAVTVSELQHIPLDEHVQV